MWRGSSPRRSNIRAGKRLRGSMPTARRSLPHTKDLPMNRYCRIAIFGVLACIGSLARAQFSDEVIRIGFITDLSGLYADIDGPAGAEMIRRAIADAGGTV